MGLKNVFAHLHVFYTSKSEIYQISIMIQEHDTRIVYLCNGDYWWKKIELRFSGDCVDSEEFEVLGIIKCYFKATVEILKIKKDQSMNKTFDRRPFLWRKFNLLGFF